MMCLILLAVIINCTFPPSEFVYLFVPDPCSVAVQFHEGTVRSCLSLLHFFHVAVNTMLIVQNLPYMYIQSLLHLNLHVLV